MKTKPRIIIRVTYRRRLKVWELYIPRHLFAYFDRKADAVGRGRSEGRRLWKQGRPAQLMIKRKRDQTWQPEATYGNDPKRSRG